MTVSVFTVLLILIPCLCNGLFDVQAYLINNNDAIFQNEFEIPYWWELNDRESVFEDIVSGPNQSRISPPYLDLKSYHSIFKKTNIRKFRNGHYLNNGVRAPA
jgi:hypothetical protein